MVRRCTSWSVALLLVLGSTVARADETPASRQLFEEGRALAKDGRYVEACFKFTKSLELDHAVGTELNLADCEERLGHLRLAWRVFLAAADELTRANDIKRANFAHERAAAIAIKMTEVVVKIATPTARGLAVTIAGHAVDPAPLVRDRTEPGTIEIVAHLPDREPFRTTVTGKANETVTIEIPPFGPVIVRSPTPITETHRRRTWTYGAIGLGATAAIGAVTSTVLAVTARSAYNRTADGVHCQRLPDGVVCDDVGDRELSNALRRADYATIGAAGAGACALGAIAIYILAPRDRVNVVPTAGRERVAVTVGWTF